jgi:hypothetical protein
MKTSAALTVLVALATLTSLALLPVLWRRRFPFTAPYFSELFVLALCPFIFTATLAFLRHCHHIASEALTPSDVIERLRPSAAMLSFGFISSAVAVSIYSLLYVLSRKARNA